MTSKIYGRTYTASMQWVEYTHTLDADERTRLADVAEEIAAREGMQAWRRRSHGRRGNIGRAPKITVTPAHVLAAARSLYEVRADRLSIGTRQIERVQ